MTNTTPFIIGVAGGSGSGKTTVSRQIQATVGVAHLAYLQHDSYYRDNAHLPWAERVSVNYDHPDSLETVCSFSICRRYVEARPSRRQAMILPSMRSKPSPAPYGQPALFWWKAS